MTPAAVHNDWKGTMDNSLLNSLEPGSQWSADDLALIAKLALKRTRKAELRDLFPGRTLGAIKNKLTIARRELGIAQPMPAKCQRDDDAFPMLNPDDPGLLDSYSKKWRAAAVLANEAYIAAIRRAA